MGRFRYWVVVAFAFVLFFSALLSIKNIYFGDDGGGTSNADSKNPQTTVVFNEIPYAQANWNVETVSTYDIGVTYEFRIHVARF